MESGRADESTLTMRDLGRVYTKLFDARAKWLDVGLALDMNFETLKSIEKEQLKNQSDCLREMLAHCIQSGCSLTWAKLCSCLRHPTVERIDLAEIIEREHPSVDINSPLPSRPSPSSAKCEEAVPFIDKCPISVEGLKQQSVDIERKFAKLAASILQSLVTRNISKDSLVACLMGFSCLAKTTDDKNQLMFRKQRRKFEDPSTNVATVWIEIGNYFSFFDYDILELIVDTLGTAQDRQNVSTYKDEFIAYAKRRLIIDLSSEDNPSTDSENPSNPVLIVLDSLYDVCEVGELKRLQINLSKLLNIREGVLQLRKVRKNCVQLVFEIPDFIIETIFPLSPDQESTLRKLGVVQLDCGDYHFEAKEDAVGECSGHDDDIDGPPDPPLREPLQPPVEHEYKADTSVNEDSLPGSTEGQSDSALPSGTYSISVEYMQTFSYRHKKPGDPDSGIGRTKTRTRAPTIRSHLTEIDSNIDDYELLRDFRSVMDDFRLSSNEPPPLTKIASSKLHSAVLNGELTKVQLLVEVFHCSPLAVNREGHTALHTAAAIGELTILKYFIEDRLVNAATESVGEETPLHCAAENGHLSTVMYLVGVQLVDPQILDGQLMSPLHCACKGGSLSTVQYLMQESQEQPCDFTKRTLSGRTLIHYAAQSGSPEVINFLLTKSDKPILEKESVNCKDKRGFTALILASLRGNFAAVKLLLQMGAEGNTQTNDGFTVLHVASQRGDCEVIGTLLEARVDINIQNQTGETSLLIASFHGHQKCVELLVEAGANVNMPKNTGSTALYMASQEGNCEIVKVLLEAKADVNRKNYEKSTALHQACGKGHDEVVKVLIAAKAEVNTQDKWGEFPLWLASFNDHQRCVEQLIEAGANVDVPKQGGFTALIVAAQNGHLKIVELLIASKANINHQTDDGFTALHMACQNGHLTVAETLITAHASVNAQNNKFNMTPLMCAAGMGRISVVELLLSKGADPNLRNINGDTACI